MNRKDLMVLGLGVVSFWISVYVALVSDVGDLIYATPGLFTCLFKLYELYTKKTVKSDLLNFCYWAVLILAGVVLIMWVALFLIPSEPSSNSVS